MSSLGVLINGGSGIVSRDILKDTNRPITNTDYFDIVITDLKPNTSYNVQFAWVYPDDTRSDYSATYTFTTSLESAPAIPSTPSVSAGPGLINVTWNGNKASGGSLTNYAKVNIYVDGVLRDFFLSAGTKSIALAKGTYSVTLRSASATDVISDPSTAASTTVTTDATDAASALSGLDNKISISASTIVNPSTKQLTDIDAGGITVYSGASKSTGARVVMNSLGIAGYNSTSTGSTTGATFSIEASTGNALFRGDITGSSGTFGGVTINSSGISTSNNIFTLNTSGSSTIAGWTITSDGFTSSSVELKSQNSLSGNANGSVIVKGSLEKYLFSGDNSGMAIINVNSAETQQFNILYYDKGSDAITLGASTTNTKVSKSYFLNGSGLRNIYASSTAGEPTPSSPANGDIKLEW